MRVVRIAGLLDVQAHRPLCPAFPAAMRDHRRSIFCPAHCSLRRIK